jgi:hypothetical protein
LLKSDTVRERATYPRRRSSIELESARPLGVTILPSIRPTCRLDPASSASRFCSMGSSVRRPTPPMTEAQSMPVTNFSISAAGWPVA